MEFLQNVDLVKLGATGVMAFGAVFAVSMFKKNLKPEEKLGLHFGFFLLFSFVPVQFANEVATRVKDAVAGTLLVAGFYQGGRQIATKAAGK